MLKKALMYACVAGSAFVPLAASADDTFARFKGGVGVIPLSNITAPPDAATPLTNANVNRNVVRGVNPAGQIWVIDKLDAKVSMNGRISVEGEGLILGGGNNIGRAGDQSVFATLLCQNDTTQYSSTLTGVPLTVTGDFRIHDRLSPVPPGTCANPVLLIRNAAGGGWFAAGNLHVRD